MASRTDLQTLLETICPVVYFQPPPDHEMVYPCIVYSRSDINTEFADDLPYKHTKRYSITVIDPDPDSTIPDDISMLPRCTFDRAFKSDQLNHDVFTILF